MDRNQQQQLHPYAGQGMNMGHVSNHQGMPQQLPIPNLSGGNQAPIGGMPHPQMQYLHPQQTQQQHSLQHEKLQQLQQFWQQQMNSIEQVQDFKSHTLPLARIKKIMKSDEDVRMISSEAPALFAKACEMFILELTLRSWNHAEENKRRTLQKDDIAAALNTVEVFDFLVDVVPQTDVKQQDSSMQANAGLMGRQQVGPDMLGYYPVNAQGQQMSSAVGAMDPMMTFQPHLRPTMK